MNSIDNNRALPTRLFIYLQERFPLMSHGMLITAFTFSAISYSRLSRGMAGFISTQDFIIGLLNGLAFFLLLRICDEFKDQNEDRLYRAYLPVPRGLVRLAELKNLGIAIGCLQLLSLLLFQPQMLGLYFIVMGYLFLMTKEFYAPQWLKQRPLIYALSHMMIIPLIDLYSSGLDWKMTNSPMHSDMLWFMLVSYLNGLVLEIGRKIKAPKFEEIGVNTYTKIYGTKPAAIMWVALLTMTLLTALMAITKIQTGHYAPALLTIIYLLILTPGIAFVLNPTVKRSILIEKASGIWTISMYLILGAFPMLNNLIA